MKELLNELLKRIEELERISPKEKLKPTYKNGLSDGKISELRNVIIRVQQILLSELNYGAKEDDDDGLVEIPEPVGKFIIDNANGTMGNDGMYYHYAEVIKLLKLYTK